MEKEWSDSELKEIARQLGKPDGENGVKTGQLMGKANNGMIRRAIEVLDVKDGEAVLEIGHGNGAHVTDIVSKGGNVNYTGVDISQTMISEASILNVESIRQGKASFLLVGAEKLPFSDHSFDKIFTVNTIYFWQKPVEYAREIFRILKFNGTFSVTLVDKSFMEKLPFTPYGFQLYSSESVQHLMQQAGFVVEDLVQEIDVTIGNLGLPVEREIMIATCKKQI